MRCIVQENGTGCGLACIAMLAGKKYETVRKTAEKVLSDSAAYPNGFGYRRSYYTTNSDVRKLAAHYGFRVGHQVKFERAIRHKQRKISSFFNNYMVEKRLNSHAIVATHLRRMAPVILWSGITRIAGSLTPGKSHATQFVLGTICGFADTESPDWSSRTPAAMKNLLMKTFSALALTLVLAAHATATPVHDAAKQGDTKAIVALLDAGAGLNARDRAALPPLHWAGQPRSH